MEKLCLGEITSPKERIAKMTDKERGNAIDWLNDLANTPAEEWQIYYSWSETKENATNALELLKEQEAKKGQWIPIESPTGVEAFGVKEMTVMNVRCSVCGSEEDVSFTGYKYCPRCGAKMEGR